MKRPGGTKSSVSELEVSCLPPASKKRYQAINRTEFHALHRRPGTRARTARGPGHKTQEALTFSSEASGFSAGKGRNSVLPRGDSLKISLRLFVLDDIWLHSAHHVPFPLLIELR